MKSHLIPLSCLLLLLPSTLFAVTECRVVELPDRFEAICEGNEKILAGSYSGVQRDRQIAADQNIGKSSKLQPQSAGVNLADGDKPKIKSAAVEHLIAYRHNKLQRSDVESKKAFRMQLMNSGRQDVTEFSPHEQTIESKPQVSYDLSI